MSLYPKIAPLKRKLFFGALALALAIGSSTQAPAAEPNRGGSLRYLLTSEPASLSLGRPTGASLSIVTKIREGLLTYDFSNAPQPLLATEWSVSEDGLVYTFKLREGVKWHDGQSFSAEDVVFSFDFNKSRIPYLQNLEKAEARGDHEVVVSFSKPVPYLLSLLGAHHIPIIQAHAYQGLDARQISASDVIIGTGPYKFGKWDRGSYVLLERNADYWQQGKPYIDEIVFPFINDASARAIAFETEEVDLGSETPVARSEVQRLQANPNLEIEKRGYERNPLVIYFGFNLRDERLADQKVRQAIAHAVNKQQALDTVWLGQGQLTRSILAPGQKPFYDENGGEYAHDIARANALLDEAGYPRRADGNRFVLRLDYFPQDEIRRYAELTKSQFAEVGIDVQIRTQEQAGFLKSIWTDYDFDLFIHSNNVDADPAVSIPRTLHSAYITPGVAFSNAVNYRNPEVDALLDFAGSAVDVDERVEAYRKFQEIIHRDIPILPVLERANVTIANKRVHDHTVSADGVAKGNLSDVWLDN